MPAMAKMVVCERWVRSAYIASWSAQNFPWRCAASGSGGQRRMGVRVKRELLEDELDLAGIGLGVRLQLDHGLPAPGALEVGELDEGDASVLRSDEGRPLDRDGDGVLKQLGRGGVHQRRSVDLGGQNCGFVSAFPDGVDDDRGQSALLFEQFGSWMRHSAIFMLQPHGHRWCEAP